MRSAFLQGVLQQAVNDRDLWLLTGDLGYSVLEPFRDQFPDRFLNVGVAEQNLIGVAAGLALAGKRVVTYSIVNFPVMRALEQIRNDVAYHNLPVLMAVVGGGLVYGAHGYTHHGAEDIGVMRLLPNLKVVVPSDPGETTWALRQLWPRLGPTYFRMARGGEKPIADPPSSQCELSTPRLVRQGHHVTIAACGPIVQLALQLAHQLQTEGIEIEVFSTPSLQPLNAEPILESARKTGRLMTLEDHGSGGLGTILAEVISQKPRNFEYRMVTYRREPVTVAGRQEFLRGLHGIDEIQIAATLRGWARQ